ncbi:MAG TPA: alcohol dehydrogenase catalytic domain-containing protein [Streptosporangiaceae bacterium]|nr:alcohol dehydrogenase catalytic domain-containing protein [Streptosporangiaceae bacterium]
MKAALITKPGHLSVEEVPDPAPRDHEVVVQVGTCGICGTDVHVYDGDYAAVREYPVIPGHEFWGTVVAAGPAVRTVRVGQQVAVDPMDYCDACATCRSGWTNMCLNGGGLGTTAPGALAEYVAVNGARCQPLPDGLAPDLASLVEPLSCVLHGLDRIGPVLGEDVLVLGSGPIGLMMAALAAAAGAHVDVVDPRADRRAVAPEFGARRAAASAGELAGDLAQGGWSVVADCTGHPGAVATGLAHLRRTGRLALLGIGGTEATFPFAPFDVVARELTIVGVNSVRHTFGRAAALLAAGTIPAARLHGPALPLAETAAALEATRRGAGLKTRVEVGHP